MEDLITVREQSYRYQQCKNGILSKNCQVVGVKRVEKKNLKFLISHSRELINQDIKVYILKS